MDPARLASSTGMAPVSAIMVLDTTHPTPRPENPTPGSIGIALYGERAYGDLDAFHDDVVVLDSGTVTRLQNHNRRFACIIKPFTTVNA